MGSSSFNNHELAAMVESAELAVWKNLWMCAGNVTSLELGMHMEQVDGACGVMMEQIPDWFFNRVIGFGVERLASEESLQRFIDLYNNKNLPMGISLSPQARPSEINDWLARRGFVEVNRWVKMYRNNGPAAAIETDLRIARATPDQFDLIGKMCCDGFGLPPSLAPLFAAAAKLPDNHGFIAWDGEQAAAMGILSVVGEVGHLNTATTLCAYRRRGAQGALMAARIQLGRELGCRWFVTETGLLEDQANPSYNNMLRNGFQLAYPRPNLVLKPGTQ